MTTGDTRLEQELSLGRNVNRASELDLTKAKVMTVSCFRRVLIDNDKMNGELPLTRDYMPLTIAQEAAYILYNEISIERYPFS